jgi:hypothetical protein
MGVGCWTNESRQYNYVTHYFTRAIWDLILMSKYTEKYGFKESLYKDVFFMKIFVSDDRETTVGRSTYRQNCNTRVLTHNLNQRH